jgi:hypothetical protein
MEESRDYIISRFKALKGKGDDAERVANENYLKLQ